MRNCLKNSGNVGLVIYVHFVRSIEIIDSARS